MKVPTEEQTRKTIKLLRDQLRSDRKNQSVKEKIMTTTPQVQELVDKYNADKTELAKFREVYLTKRKDVREMHAMLKTLAKFGVVDESVLGTDEDENDEDKTESKPRNRQRPPVNDENE